MEERAWRCRPTVVTLAAHLPEQMTEPKARAGWQSDFPEFRAAEASAIRATRAAFVAKTPITCSA